MVVNYPSNPFNHNKKRNIRNTKKRTYNCGGYALGTFSWFIPMEVDDFLNFEGTQEECINECTKVILSECPEWFLISESDMKNNKYSCYKYEIIAFRISFQDDFHFLKLGKNNIWYDKLGNSAYIERHNYNYVFNSTWNGRYDSDVRFFARKR